VPQCTIAGDTNECYRRRKIQPSMLIIILISLKIPSYSAFCIESGRQLESAGTVEGLGLREKKLVFL